MAASHPNRHSIGSALVLALVVAAPAYGQSKQSKRTAAEITLEAASSEVDYGNNNYLFRSVTITQGDLKVTADEARATGTDFDNATWDFTGKVRIVLPNGGLRSNLARIQFRNNVIAVAHIEGQPAEFEQQRPNTPEPARGRARNIDYDVTTGLVKLSNEAWLSDGRNEITGNELVYNLADQKVRAQAKPGDGTSGIRITIRPGTGQPVLPGSKPPSEPRP